MKDRMEAITFMPDNAEDSMVEEAVGLAYTRAMQLAVKDGAAITGPLTMKLVRHEPTHDEDGNFMGHHDEVRLLIDCERGAAPLDAGLDIV